MGQLIEVDHLLLGETAVFDTDRTFSGQEGESYPDAGAAAGAGTYPGRVAAALFEKVPSLRSVYVFSNVVSARKAGGWTEEQADEAAGVIRDALVHYDRNRSQPE